MSCLHYIVLGAPGQCVDEDGNVFDDGDEIPDDDPCKTCRCDNGEKICATVQCDIPVCGPGYEIVYPPDQCCPSCQKSKQYRHLRSLYGHTCHYSPIPGLWIPVDQGPIYVHSSYFSVLIASNTISGEN